MVEHKYEGQAGGADVASEGAGGLPMSCRSLLNWLPSAPWPVAVYKFSIDCNTKMSHYWQTRIKVLHQLGEFLFYTQMKGERCVQHFT